MEKKKYDLQERLVAFSALVISNVDILKKFLLPTIC